MGVVIKRWVWLECIGVVSGCCKEVYRFPHITYPYNIIYTPLVLAHFCSSIPTFCSFFKMIFHSLISRVRFMKKEHCARKRADVVE